MNLKCSKINKIKIGLVTIVTVASVGVTPVYADTLMGSYPTQVNSIPDFYISKVDMMNNQLRFSFDPLFTNGKVISSFGAGWITDRTEAMLNKDIRTFAGVSGEGLQRVFWSEDWDVEDFYSGDSSFRKIYTVDAEVSLRDNPYDELFYIVEFTDGDAWMNKLNYGECGSKWVEGKSCDAGRYTIGKEEDNVYYQLANAPEKFIRTKFTKKTLGATDTSGVGDDTATDTSDTGDATSDISGTSDAIGDASGTGDTSGTATSGVVKDTDDKKNTSDVASTDITDEPDDKVETVTKVIASTVKYLTDSTSGFSKDEDEPTEVNEGFGDTTLDVPVLGKEKACEEVNIWPYLAISAGVGAISTWFLLLIINQTSRNNWR